MAATSKTKHNTYQQQAKSVSQFLRIVGAITKEWNELADLDFYPWFRGHANSAWPLLPSVYRETYINSNEDNFRHDFKRKALPFLAGTATEPRTEWDWYFLMQHYGLPTRLLDWTESALVALYFALRDATPENHAAVWVLDPWKLNEKVAGVGYYFMTADSKETKTYLWPPYYPGRTPQPPIQIQPAFNSQRISAQRGAFTIHGRAIKPLEDYSRLRKYLIKVEIAQNRLEIMKEELRLAGVTESAFFPELSGLCREILDHWRE
jgi:hypothetical protein